MNLTEMGSGTRPIKPIELTWHEPISGLCECTWQFDVEKRIKSVKFLYASCGIPDHVTAFYDARRTVLVAVPEPPKRGRGRPANPGGQWHKKKKRSALTHRGRNGSQ